MYEYYISTNHDSNKCFEHAAAKHRLRNKLYCFINYSMHHCLIILLVHAKYNFQINVKSKLTTLSFIHFYAKRIYNKPKLNITKKKNENVLKFHLESVTF